MDESAERHAITSDCCVGGKIISRYAPGLCMFGPQMVDLGEDWYIDMVQGWYGEFPVAVRFCPFCGARLPETPAAEIDARGEAIR